MQFKQKIENITEDSEFLFNLIKDLGDKKTSIELIEESISNEDFILLDEFYNDYTKFNLEKSTEIIALLDKLEFNQTRDFAMLTIFKFRIVTFEPREFNIDDLFDLVREYKENIEEDADLDVEFYEYKDVDMMQICAENGFVLTAKWLFNFYKLDKDIYDYMIISGENEQINMLELIYNREKYNEEKIYDLIIEMCKNDKLKSVIFLNNILNIVNNEEIFMIISMEDSINISKWIYSLNKDYMIFLENNFDDITESVDIIEWMVCDLNYQYKKDNIISMFSLACGRSRFKLIKFLLDNEEIPDMIISYYFRYGVKNNPKLADLLIRN